MRIDFDFPDGLVEADVAQRLRRSLELEDAAELGPVLGRLAGAALGEYIAMITGAGMAGNIDEARQERLVHLVRHYYEERMPSQSELKRVFQLTDSQARLLLGKTVARRGHELEEPVAEMLARPVREAEPDEGDWLKTRITSGWVLDALNDLLEAGDGTYRRLRAKQGIAGVYRIQGDARAYLAEKLGVELEGEA